MMLSLTDAIFPVTSELPTEASSMLRAISLEAALCSSTAVAMGDRNLLGARHGALDALEGTDRMLAGFLNAGDLLPDIAGCLACLGGQRLDFGGDNGKALASFARSGRFNRGVERQKIGLVGDVGDQRHDGSNAVGRAGEALQVLAGLPHFVDGIFAMLSGAHDLLIDFAYGVGQLFGGRGHRVDIARRLF